MFTFTSLPTELRLKIYTFLLPAPKIHYIGHNPTTNTLTSCNTKFPTILHINREARHEGLRYLLQFTPKPPPPPLAHGTLASAPETEPGTPTPIISPPTPPLSAQFYYLATSTLFISHAASTSIFSTPHTLRIELPFLAIEIESFRMLMTTQSIAAFVVALDDMQCERVDVLGGLGPRAREVVDAGMELDIKTLDSNHYQEKVGVEWARQGIGRAVPKVRIARHKYLVERVPDSP